MDQDLPIEETAEVKLTPELSEAENAAYQEKAKSLSSSIEGNPKVHVVVQINKDTLARSVCFLREPNYETKITIMDKQVQLGIYKGADLLREACTLKEASDPITYGESPECDSYKMGVTEYCIGMVKRLANQFKKN
jgi:hypothetical protein